MKSAWIMFFRVYMKWHPANNMRRKGAQTSAFSVFGGIKSAPTDAEAAVQLRMAQLRSERCKNAASGKRGLSGKEGSHPG